ncbi:Lrp/AsnC ligand binding domain-containing protein [Rouxiella badensis]|jgi:hypothetical protein|nr:Lrp/AsnC ligand binding domain-containing protein [Rouxiella badensis]MCC3704953.1 Lrp/AsnC ligand binding domain-containing protein [Rouxiella badensis]MCC3721411.1 Lrp/AsnC ligand binding domain-containing protein [Rouxiella badensis]MCC3730976.1 Lrp/AsnC ligand binding domain-containing protein [Rouxiella badensis]MCC3735592.1 Lrp/AsnC ligand binding domain-containing protein [Rouxiella badensis]MCC3742287.1 Lrp/AsnC ligand binding domain-containing protein [Rouxiella badensis]
MNVAVEGAKASVIIQQLRGEPAVHTLHTTNGKWDLLVELGADNLEIFDQILGRIRRIEGIFIIRKPAFFSRHARREIGMVVP